MSLSAYPIGGRVWLIRTDKTADETVPATLPINSVVLEPEEAAALYFQLGIATTKAREAA